jgi:CheY-like chemotaxis protein
LTPAFRCKRLGSHEGDCIRADPVSESGLAPIDRAKRRGEDRFIDATILIVDDHALFRHTARELLESEGFVVVGEVADGSSAIAAARELQPEVVLLDVQLPDIDGFEVARRLREKPAGPMVILTSIRDASNYRSRLPGTPARTFIGKADLTGARIAALIAEQR